METHPEEIIEEQTEIEEEKTAELNTPKTIWYTDRFIQAIENSVKKHPVPYEKMPEIIEIKGIIADSIDKILKETMDDPEKKERAMSAKINIDGEMMIGNSVNVGTTDKVLTNISLRRKSINNDSRYEKREYLAFVMHTHGTFDAPASFVDMKGLIVDFEKSSVQAVFVITPTTKMLFIRSLETPELGPDQAEEIIKNRTENLTKEIVHHLIKNKVDSDAAAQIKKNMYGILDFCREYKIAIYNSFEGHRYMKLNT
ncbi:MAG: hypothetical protein WCV55_03145 [Candidatus Paceibacterota bacterium]